ncbi:MAG: hypothetical protein JWQ38_3096 [Flavipsychrobacter sp.]|nr:hypothetical protein [Flavipsychrobacter sp.]
MTPEVQRYMEPLATDELSFLQRKESKERSQYYKTFRMLMIMSFIIPFAGAWYRASDGAPNAFSVPKFYVAAGVLLSISSISTYLTYRINLRKIQWDIRDRTKTIEISHVTRKLYLGVKNTYYFYIDSRIKLSIEVSEADYYRINEGDEVCIEYTTHSKNYLGYF